MLALHTPLIPLFICKHSIVLHFRVDWWFKYVWTTALTNDIQINLCNLSPAHLGDIVHADILHHNDIITVITMGEVVSELVLLLSDLSTITSPEHTFIFCSICELLFYYLPFAVSAKGSERRDFLQEIEMMKKVSEGQNPHVVTLIGCVTVQEPLCIVTEYVKYGDLLTYLRTNRQLVSKASNLIYRSQASNHENQLFGKSLPISYPYSLS